LQRQSASFVIAALVAALASLGACASADEAARGPAADAWVDQHANANTDFPDLRDVPRGHLANVDQAHWDAVAADLLAAGAALKASPRAQYGAPPEDPNAFLEDAREDLDRTRESH
jgi:hypothetical protein